MKLKWVTKPGSKTCFLGKHKVGRVKCLKPDLYEAECYLPRTVRYRGSFKTLEAGMRGLTRIIEKWLVDSSV